MPRCDPAVRASLRKLARDFRPLRGKDEYPRGTVERRAREIVDGARAGLRAARDGDCGSASRHLDRALSAVRIAMFDRRGGGR